MIVIRYLLAAVALISAVPSYADDSGQHSLRSDPEGTPIVVGSVHKIQSTVYGKEQTLTVRLPRGYADDPDRTWPVLFSVDGGPEQDFELLAGIAAEAEFSTSFEPFILIGVQTDDRYSQLTPPMTRMPMERLTENFGDRIKPGGAIKFRDYLATDVIPWVKSRYRTDRKILTAVSLGGLFVTDTFFERPEMFDDYIAITPSLWWDAGRIADEAAAKLAAQRPSDRRFYLAMGDEGVGNLTGQWLATLVDAFRNHVPEGVKWAFVDRSGSEEHRTMALTTWLDAMRTLYLTPSRTGALGTMIYPDYKAPAYTTAVRQNLDAGRCRREIARPTTFAEKNDNYLVFYGQCVLMKPGLMPTATNFTLADYGRPPAGD